MEDEQIRSQMRVLDHFALFVPRVFSQQSAATEGHPLNKEVERFTYVRCRLNRPPEVDVEYVVEEKRGSDYALQLTKGEVQLILA